MRRPAVLAGAVALLLAAGLVALGMSDRRSESEALPNAGDVLAIDEAATVDGLTLRVAQVVFAESVPMLPPANYLMFDNLVDNAADKPRVIDLFGAWSVQTSDGSVLRPHPITSNEPSLFSEGATAQHTLVFEIGDRPGRMFVRYQPEGSDDPRVIWEIRR